MENYDLRNNGACRRCGYSGSGNNYSGVNIPTIRAGYSGERSDYGLSGNYLTKNSGKYSK